MRTAMQNYSLVLRLNPAPEQHERLLRLQALFAQACTSLGPVVQETRCWNRVALHHLVYRRLREDFPQLGSQMACNVIYSVSRAARQVYQGRNSPWLVGREGDRPLPLLAFGSGAPVYFDRHTLSLRKGVVSLYTLDGRLQFDLGLSAEDVARFTAARLREIVLNRDAQGFFLSFSFDQKTGEGEQAELPAYLLVLDAAAP